MITNYAAHPEVSVSMEGKTRLSILVFYDITSRTW